jgi:hypothetical protein
VQRCWIEAEKINPFSAIHVVLTLHCHASIYALFTTLYLQVFFSIVSVRDSRVQPG